MVAIAQKHISMFELRNNLYSQLEIPLQNALELLSNDIKTFLLSDKKIEKQVDNVLAQMYNLVIEAEKWRSVNSDRNILELTQDITPQIEKFSANPQLEVLTENILFALRCNKRIIEGAIKMRNIDKQANSQEDNYADNKTENPINIGGFEVPNITYNELKASLEDIDVTFSEKVMTFINAPLNIEWVILVTDIINDNKMVISDEKINELCVLVIQQAEEYMDIAMELGYLAQPIKETIREIETNDDVFDADFIKEQKELADLGLEDWINL